MSSLPRYGQKIKELGSDGKQIRRTYKMGRIAQKSHSKADKEINIIPDYDNQHNSLVDDIIVDGSDSEGDDDESKSSKKRGSQEEESKSSPDFMFFDFRRGGASWPKNVELIDGQKSEDLLNKAIKQAEEVMKMKKKEGDDDESKRESSSRTVSIGPEFINTADVKEDFEEEEEGTGVIHPDAVFETLKDGSTAFILKPGYRLKLKLGELLEGGDEKKEAREKKANRMKKKMAEYFINDPWGMGKYGEVWGQSSYSYSKWFKKYINDYTITIDMKLLEDIPREGISLFQTALIHCKENKKTGASPYLSLSQYCPIRSCNSGFTVVNSCTYESS